MAIQQIKNFEKEVIYWLQLVFNEWASEENTCNSLQKSEKGANDPKSCRLTSLFCNF